MLLNIQNLYKSNNVYNKKKRFSTFLQFTSREINFLIL